MKQDGLSISEIARRSSVDWKTVQKIVAQSQEHRKEDPDKGLGKNDSQDECELSKVVFKKLNSGESPEKIVAEIGHLDRVIEWHKKWKMLRGCVSENSSAPDPKIVRSLYPWLDSVDECPEWNHKMAHKFLAGFAWIRMGVCPNYKKMDVECAQLEENNPYACLACVSYSPKDSLTSELDF